MILYYILKPLVILLNYTPRKFLHCVAKFMAFMLWHISKERRHVAVTEELKRPLQNTNNAALIIFHTTWRDLL